MLRHVAIGLLILSSTCLVLSVLSVFSSEAPSAGELFRIESLAAVLMSVLAVWSEWR